MANVAEFQSKHIERYRAVLASHRAKMARRLSSVDPRSPGIAHYGEAELKAQLARLDAHEQSVLLGREGAEAGLTKFLAELAVEVQP
jgi:hypothetical protein